MTYLDVNAKQLCSSKNDKSKNHERAVRQSAQHYAAEEAHLIEPG